MGQRQCLIAVLAGVVMTIASLASCNKAAAPAPAAKRPKTIASLVPAVTDLVIGMGARDRLVAVSNFDRDRGDVDALPKAGDYQAVDWEALQTLQPSIIAIQIAKDRIPAGFNERAEAMHARVEDFRFERLDEVFEAIEKLGAHLELVDEATAAERQLRASLDDVRRRVGSAARVKVLIVSSDGQTAAGPGTFLDDLLEVAGGQNVLPAPGRAWPQLDHEMLTSLKPDAIIQLLPNGSAQAKAQAAAKWAQLPQIPAVTAGRVYTIDAWYAELPGWHVGDLAGKFAECLHPSTPSSSPTTNPATP